MAFKNVSTFRPMGKSALRNVERQRQMAQALQGQAMQPLRGQMAGRVYVAPSPMQGVAKLGQMLAGTYGQNKANEREAQIEADQRQAFATDVQRYHDAMKPTQKVIEQQGDPYEIYTQQFTEDGQPIGGNTHVPAQVTTVPGMSMGDASSKFLLGGTSEDAQKLGKLAFTESLKPKKDTRTNFQKNFEARENYPEGSEGWNRLTAKLDKDVNVPSHYEKTYQKERDKHFATNMNNIEIAAQKGHVKVGKINRMEQLLKGIDDSGEFAMIKVSVANFFKSAFGKDIDEKLGAKQAAIGMANELATELRPPASGVMTNADFDHFLESIPSLMLSIEGRRLMANTMRKFVEAEQQVARMAAAYENKHGRLDAGFTQVLTNHFSANPIYKRPENMPDVDSKVSNGKQTYTPIYSQ